MPAIPLEDNFNDIISKAMRGLKLGDETVATSTGLTVEAIQSLREGTWNADAARRISTALGLGAEALVGIGEKTYHPADVKLDGLAQFNTVYEDMTVNCYVAWDDQTREAVAFDTGTDCTEVLELLRDRNLTLSAILLTHTHGDHVFELDRLKERTGAPAYVGDREPLDGAETFAAGRKWAVGKLVIDSQLTWGHSQGGITFVVKGLAKPVAVVGDAVFAGSMGGGGISYDDALRTNRAEIFQLSDDTILCPGHGPMTTLGEERKSNPFYAA